MLKRNKLLIAFLVATVICASVGFAAVMDDLTATGDPELDLTAGDILDQTFEADIHFVALANDAVQYSYTSGSGVSAALSADTVTGNSNVAGSNDTLTFTFEATNNAFQEVDDTVTITAKIVNEGDTIANVTVNTSTYSNDYVSVTHVLSNGESLEKNEEATLVITVKLLKIPAGDTIDLGTYTATIVAKPASPAN